MSHREPYRPEARGRAGPDRDQYPRTTIPGSASSSRSVAFAVAPLYIPQTTGSSGSSSFAPISQSTIPGSFHGLSNSASPYTSTGPSFGPRTLPSAARTDLAGSPTLSRGYCPDGRASSDPTMYYSGYAAGALSATSGHLGPAPGSFPIQPYQDWDPKLRDSPDSYAWEQDSPTSPTSSDFIAESTLPRQAARLKSQAKSHAQRRPSNRDEFDGPHQLLDRLSAETVAAQERELPHLPTNLLVQEQDHILAQVNDRLSQCAFDFVAKYQFPIPLESDKRPVRTPQDREWTEWVYLLKRLATKRRIPARVLYNSQIKQLVTVLENSLEMRHAAKHQSRPLKDDRNVLQLISAGIQVTKILKDAAAMEFLDHLYVHTERLIHSRRSHQGFST